MNALRLLLLSGLLASVSPPMAQATLFDDLGGQPGVSAIVDRAVARWLADPRVGPTFADTNMTRFRHLLNEQLCAVAEGPCRYTGKDMAAAHRGLDLHRNQFNALAEDLQDAMEELGIAYHTQNRLIARLAPMQRDVVTQ